MNELLFLGRAHAHKHDTLLILFLHLSVSVLNAEVYNFATTNGTKWNCSNNHECFRRFLPPTLYSIGLLMNATMAMWAEQIIYIHSLLLMFHSNPNG